MFKGPGPDIPSRSIMAVFDFDGTLTRYDSYLSYLIAHAVARPARFPQMWALPLDVICCKLGLQDNSWLKQRFLQAVLGGLTAADLRQSTERFLDRLLANGLRRKAVDALKAHQSCGHRTVLLSASPALYVQRAAERLGFSDCLCTVAEWDTGGVLTGCLAGPNCYGEEKVRRLSELVGAERQAWHIVAYGDHRSDLPLLKSADAGCLINPSRVLARKAVEANLRVLYW